MSFPYSNSLAGAPASYPGSLFDPVDIRNRVADGVDIVDEAFAVPADPDSEGRYRVNLNQAILNRAGVDIRVNGQARTPVPYGQAVGAAQVGVSLETGVLEFNAADANGSGLASYKAAGTAMMAHIINRVQNELKATQQAVDAFDVDLGSPGPIGDVGPNTGAFTTLQADSLGVSDSGGLSSWGAGNLAISSEQLRIESMTRTLFRRFNNAAGNGAMLDFYRARGTAASPAPITTNDQAGRLRWTVLDPFDAGVDINVADIRVGAPPGNMVSAGRLSFWLNAGNDPIPNYETLRVDWGKVTIGANSAADLAVNGDVECDDVLADGELHAQNAVEIGGNNLTIVKAGTDTAAALFGQPIGIAWQEALQRMAATATPDTTRAPNVPFAASRFDAGNHQGITAYINFIDSDYREHEVEIVGGIIIGWTVQ